MAASFMRRRPRLFPTKLALGKTEDRRAFERLKRETLMEWQPSLGEESHLCERLILALWNLRRAAEADAKVMAADEIDPQLLTTVGRYRKAQQREIDTVVRQLRTLKGAVKHEAKI